MWSTIGEIIFTVVVGYMGAIELLFVAKQLYHLAFQHQRRQMLLADNSGLRQLQERVEREIVEASQKEILGYNAMKDGILYKDGFRIDPGEINDHETLHRQVSEGTKSGRDLSGDRTENIVKTTCETTSESEIREEVIEEPCIKKVAKRVASPRPESTEAQEDDEIQTTLTQSVKTQIGQTNLEEFIQPPEKEVLAEAQVKVESSEETTQKQPSSFEAPHFEEYQREEPEGQDVPEPQYSDDYLRSLDGIKIRPLVRDDGTRRRRAFKKRHSSDSTSSRESRASREEELKMFTSLEEEEFEAIRKGDYVPIKYSSDPNLLKAAKHQRRHKKSPIKDIKHGESEDSRGSLEMLDEENSGPWGEIKPEHYKDTEFWKREKAVSIEEESEENAPSLRGEDIEQQQAGQLIASPTPTKHLPQFSSFEEATDSQHHEVVSTLTKQKSKDEATKPSEKGVEKVSSTPSPSEAGLEGNLIEHKTSGGTEETVACRESDEDAHHNVGLRRSPRFDNIDHYEEHLHEEDENAKVRAISPSEQPCANKLESPLLTEPQSDVKQSASEKTSPSPVEESLRSLTPQKSSDLLQPPVIEVIRVETTPEEPGSLLEGVSDFYDFNASINPSRSPSKERTLRISVSPPRSQSPIKLIEEENRNKIPFNTDDLSALSGFFDFCMNMNRCAYGHNFQRAHSAHRSSTDFLEAKLKARKSKSKSPSLLISAPKNGVAPLPEVGGGTPNLEISPSEEKPSLKIEITTKDCNRSPSPLDTGDSSTRKEKSHNISPLNTPLTPENLENFNLQRDPFYTASTPLETPETSSPETSSLKIEIRTKDCNRSPSPLDTASSSTTRKRSHNTSPSPLSTPLTPENLEKFNLQRDPFYTTSTPLETPETPDFQRSFSANMRYLEKMKDEYRSNAFKRSTYIGESMDFENDFEELREKTRHFKRSRSRSRSPLLEDEMDPCTSSQAAQKELQDKILEEITKTTIHYQDFSRDMSQRFIDYDRRGSDSALLQKEYIPIEDNLRDIVLKSDEDMLNELEGEEYHHFRRYSLNLHCLEEQEEEDEDSNYVYVEEINVQIGCGTKNWTKQDFYDKEDTKTLETESIQESTASLDITNTDSDHAEAEDIDTESEDDRQTVVEVDDEIDEDVFDFERPEEQSNEQSECEEAEREMDRYANKNANDWNDEGAIGGFALPVNKLEDESITIDQMYNDAVQNTEESGIEKDYDTIVEAINEEERLLRNSNENKDIATLTTEDLLDEILREDEKQNSHRSPRRENIEATTNFINNEVSAEISNKNNVKSTTTSSTRLRSRYGYGPAIVHRNYDDLDDLDVDLDYKPKKEYKWRKNFRLDDENDFSNTTEKSQNQNNDCNLNSNIDLEQLDNGQQIRVEDNKSLLSQEEKSISLVNSNNLEEFNEENNKAESISKTNKDNGAGKGAVKKQKSVREKIVANLTNNIEDSIPEKEELKSFKGEEPEKTSKKKKTKRKTRRGSKASLSNDEDGNGIPSPSNDENKEPGLESLRKERKPKRKKKILEALSPPTSRKVSTDITEETFQPLECAKPSETNLKLPSPPRPDALLNATNFQPPTKSLSPSPAKTPPPASNCRTPNIQPLEQLPEASKTSVHLTATSDAGQPESKSKSKSSSPKPAASNGTTTSTQPPTPSRPQLERNDSSGVYELIKDGSMYPWF